MSKLLVAYYSRTGNTRRVAEVIARACHAEIEEIEDVRPRRGLFGWIRCLRESIGKRPAAIVTPTFDPTKFDLVILGTPVWASSMSSPLRRYLEDAKGRLPSIAIFITEGGRGGEITAAEIENLCGRKALATLVLTAQDLATSDWETRAISFANGLHAAPAKWPVTHLTVVAVSAT